MFQMAASIVIQFVMEVLLQGAYQMMNGILVPDSNVLKMERNAEYRSNSCMMILKTAKREKTCALIIITAQRKSNTY